MKNWFQFSESKLSAPYFGKFAFWAGLRKIAVFLLQATTTWQRNVATLYDQLNSSWIFRQMLNVLDKRVCDAKRCRSWNCFVLQRTETVWVVFLYLLRLLAYMLDFQEERNKKTTKYMKPMIYLKLFYFLLIPMFEKSRSCIVTQNWQATDHAGVLQPYCLDHSVRKSMCHW